jgi:transcriptional regulator with XRE-family HTH domain
MRPSNLLGSAPATSGLSARDTGTIVRAARQAKGLTLAELGQRLGYSASQISRYERGIQSLTDVRLLHRLALALAIPPQALGLVPPLPAGRHAEAARSDGNEDPVRRREPFSHAAGLIGAAALGVPASGHTRGLADPGRGLESLIYGSATLRRTGRPAQARELLDRAARDIEPGFAGRIGLPGTGT